MALRNMNTDDLSERSIAFISLSNLYTTYPRIIAHMVILRHTINEIPHNLNLPQNSSTAFFASAVDQRKLIEISFNIVQSILKVYPNVLFRRVLFNTDIIIWNLSPEITVKDLRCEIIERLLENPIFDGVETISGGMNRPGLIPTRNLLEISDFPGFSSPVTSLRIIRRNLDSPNVLRCFNIFNKKSEFTLQRTLCNYVAKRCMKKILLHGIDNGIRYFSRRIEGFVLTYLNNSKSVFDEMSVFNVILLLDKQGFSRFKERYLALIDDLELNHYIIDELRSYCPSVFY